MLSKQNNLRFLQAIQEKKFEEAYQIGESILAQNPNEQSIKRFMLFLQNNFDNIIIYNINVNQQFESDDEEENNEEYSKRMRAKPKKLMNQQFTLSQSKAKMQKLAKNDEINLGIMKNSERQQTRTTLKTFQIKTQLQFEQSPKNPLQYLSGKIAIPISQISFPSLQPK